MYPHTIACLPLPHHREQANTLTKSRLGATSTAVVDINDRLLDFSARKASKRDTYFAIFGLLGNDVELRNGFQAVFTHPDASWAEQDFEDVPATAPGRRSVPDVLEPQHEPQFDLPTMMQSSNPWRNSIINPAMLSTDLGTHRGLNGDLPTFQMADPFQAGSEHVQPYHSNGHHDYQSVVPTVNTGVQHFASANSQPISASEYQSHPLNSAAQEPTHQNWERTLPSLPRPMVPSQRAHSLGDALSAVHYHHGRQNWVDDAFYEPHRSFSVFETPRMSVPQLDSPNKSSLELSPSMPHTPNQMMFTSMQYEAAPRPAVESAPDNSFQQGWQGSEQNYSPQMNEQGSFKQQAYPARNEQALSPRDAEHLGVREPAHTGMPLNTESSQPSPVLHTDLNFVGNFRYVHSLCGKAFTTRSGVKKHHWGGGKLGDRETVTGCWARHGKPDIEWDDHPTCKLEDNKSSAPRIANKQSRPSKPRTPVAAPMASPNPSYSVPAQQQIQQPLQAPPPAFHPSPQLPSREGAQMFHSHQLPRPGPPGISNALLTAVNAASDINPPRAEARNDPVVQPQPQPPDARTMFLNQAQLHNQNAYQAKSAHVCGSEYPTHHQAQQLVQQAQQVDSTHAYGADTLAHYQFSYRPLAPAPTNPSLRGGAGSESLRALALQDSGFNHEAQWAPRGMGETKRSHEQLLDASAASHGHTTATGAQSFLDPAMEGHQNKRRRSVAPEKESKSLIVRLRVDLANWSSVGVPAGQKNGNDNVKVEHTG